MDTLCPRTLDNGSDKQPEEGEGSEQVGEGVALSVKLESRKLCRDIMHLPENDCGDSVRECRKEADDPPQFDSIVPVQGQVGREKTPARSSP